jgi:hypothetical protein
MTNGLHGSKEHKEYVRLSTKLYDFCGIKHDHIDWSMLPNLVESLDAQYVYLWPKLTKEGFEFGLYTQQENDYTFGLNCDDINFAVYEQNVNPARACALAVEKLINSRQTK